MKKKNKQLYINIWEYEDKNYPFQIFIGGRGTGKTYSALSGAVTGKVPEGKKFIFMRRTAQELDIMMDSAEKGEGANPFKPINRNCNKNLGLRQIVKNLAGIYERTEGEAGKLEHKGEPVGYATALSTISSIRGIDFSDCSDCIYDEFIPEKHVRKLKGEADALFNAYETINRNRELEGEAPLRLWLLANSNDIYNPIFVGLGVVNHIERMLKKGKSDFYLDEKGLAIHLISDNQEFVEKKSQTALYKLTAGTQFSEMALSNSFAYNDFNFVCYRNIKGYQPVCALNDRYFIYRKKGTNEFYCCYARARVQNFNIDSVQGQKAFLQTLGNAMRQYFIAGLIEFESYNIKQRILDIIL